MCNLDQNSAAASFHLRQRLAELIQRERASESEKAQESDAVRESSAVHYMQTVQSDRNKTLERSSSSLRTRRESWMSLGKTVTFVDGAEVCVLP